MALVCSTEFVFHNFFTPDPSLIESVLHLGLRPLSDFPESERWQQIEKEVPGFFERLYDDIAAPVIGKPYQNSGIFVSPIDFRLLPGSYFFDRPRVRIPVARLEPEYSCLTYVWEEERVILPLEERSLLDTARLWTADKVMDWFARDQTKVFFYVPQIVTYQGKVAVEVGDIERG